MNKALATIELPSHQTMPVLGQGTWHMGDSPALHAQEVRSLQHGLDLGMTLIDTAEMYGFGASEQVVGAALQGRRQQAFVVSKVLPQNATAQGIRQACMHSLKHLGIDKIDLYLLHWRDQNTNLQEVVETFEALKAQGHIGAWGVSNFDVDDMEELWNLPRGNQVAVNQVLYNLSCRGIEFDLLPWCQARGIGIMAYSPLDEGRLLRNTSLIQFAQDRGLTAAQVALAFVLSRKGVAAIPKASSALHTQNNRNAADIVLSDADLAQLDTLFAAPTQKMPLAII